MNILMSIADSFIKYFEFIITQTVFSLDAVIAIYMVPLMFGVNILMPSKKARHICAGISVLACVTGLILGANNIFPQNPEAGSGIVVFRSGFTIGLYSVISVPFIAIGSIISSFLKNKKCRKLISTILIIAVFLMHSLYFHVANSINIFVYFGIPCVIAIVMIVLCLKSRGAPHRDWDGTKRM